MPKNEHNGIRNARRLVLDSFVLTGTDMDTTPSANTILQTADEFGNLQYSNTLADVTIIGNSTHTQDLGVSGVIYADKIDTGSTNGLDLHVNGSQSMFLENGGNVGIGTNNPTADLHIFSSAVGGTIFRVESNVDTAGSGLFLETNGTNWGFVANGSASAGGLANKFHVFDLTSGLSRWIINPTGEVIVPIKLAVGGGTTLIPTIDLAIGDNNTGLNQQAEDELAVYTGNVERMRFDSAGLVGIGTANPAAKLDIFDATSSELLHLENTTAAAGITMRFFNNGTDWSLNTGGSASSIPNTFAIRDETAGAYRLLVNSSGHVNIPISIAVGGFFDPTIDLAIGDTNTGFNQEGEDELAVYTGGTERMRFDAAGLVGIGTNNPTQTLHVQGDTLVQGGDIFLVDTSEKISSDGTDMTFHVGGSQKVLFEDGGNVGIGTLNARETLHITGGGTGFLRIDNPTATTGVLIGYGSGESILRIQQREDDNIDFYTNSVVKMTLTTGGGSLGIGTTIPSHKLHVNGDVLVEGGDLFLSNTSEKIASNGTDMFFHVNGSEVVRFDSTGCVGINNNAPVQILHVVGQDNAFLRLDTPTATAGCLIGYPTGSTLMRVGNRQNDDLEFRTNNSTKMTIEAGGDVGIGTTNPAELLHLLGDGNVWLRMNTPTATAGVLIGYGASTSVFRLQQRENADMEFYTNDALRMTIEGAGDVGIGTSPDTLFHIYEAFSPTITLESDNLNSSNAVSFITNSTDWKLTASGSGAGTIAGDFVVRNDTAGTNILVVQANGNVGIQSSSQTHTFELVDDDGAKLTTTTWTTTSDQQFKKNVVDISITASRNCMLNIQPREYEYNDLGVSQLGVTIGITHLGFVAQELETICPEVVSDVNLFDLGITGGVESYKTINIHNLFIHQLNVTKDLLQRIEILENN